MTDGDTMQATDDDPHRYLRQVKAVCERHLNDPAAAQEQRLRAHLDRLRAEGWSRYDCDRVEERARLIFGLPEPGGAARP
jgi:hypothetical protein